MPSIRHDLSVVIGTFNRARLLRSTIEQLAEQPTLPGTCVVVDQGDERVDDAVLEPLRILGVRTICKYSAYRSISAARNIGMELSGSASIILYIDDDVELECDVVAEHARYYDDEPDTVTVAGHVTCVPGSPEFNRMNTYKPAGEYLHSGRGCHMSFRTRVLREVGGFNAYICNNGDETELFRRLTKAGYRVRNGKRAVLKHLVSPSGGNRQVHLGSHANYGRVLRDGMVRIAKDQGLLVAVLWPLKNWPIAWGLLRTSPSWTKGIHTTASELIAAIRLARLSAAKTDYIPLSVQLSSGAGVDPRSGLPTV